MAGLTIAGGGKNLAAYTPFFATAAAGQITVTVNTSDRNGRLPSVGKGILLVSVCYIRKNPAALGRVTAL